MQFTPYLYFKGDCEAALEFYATCGLGSIRDLRRYEGTPMEGRDGGAWGAKVLHSFFEGPSLRLYASDGPNSEPMKGCALLIESDSVGDAERLFELLSAEGRVTVPFKKQFWGDRYGMVADPFGHHWSLGQPVREVGYEEIAATMGTA